MNVWLWGILIPVLQAFSWAGLPLLWRGMRTRSFRFKLEDLWTTTLLGICLQAISGTCWSLITPSWPAQGQLVLWLLQSLLLGEFLLRCPPPAKQLTQKSWMWLLVLAAAGLRIYPAALQNALGQSDAYSHLQFGYELLEKGVLSNPLYPPGHAWVQILPSLIRPVDLYMLYRFGGTLPGVLLVLGIFFAARRAAGERPAYCAALLVAGCPLMLPLIKTGIGVYANQLGLLLIPWILWSLFRRPVICLIALFTLALCVPMMLIDLLPAVGLAILLQQNFRLLGGLLLCGGAAVGVISYRLLELPPEHFSSTLFMLSGTHAVDSLPDLILHYLSPKAFSFPWQIHFCISLLSLAAAGSLIVPSIRGRRIRLYLLLTAWCGLQTATGCFQFAAYQRAGWLFLIGLAVSTGWLGWRFSRRLQLQPLARPLLAASGLFFIWQPPLHQPQLSSSEDDLLLFLHTLANNPPTQSVQVWTRPFTDFQGNQGDPVNVLLRDNESFTIRHPKPHTVPVLDTEHSTWVILDTRPPPLTPHKEFNAQTQKLWQMNTEIKAALNQVPMAERWEHPRLDLPGLEIWHWGPQADFFPR